MNEEDIQSAQLLVALERAVQHYTAIANKAVEYIDKQAKAKEALEAAVIAANYQVAAFNARDELAAEIESSSDPDLQLRLTLDRIRSRTDILQLWKLGHTRDQITRQLATTRRRVDSVLQRIRRITPEDAE
jgi:hypothetical protein